MEHVETPELAATVPPELRLMVAAAHTGWELEEDGTLTRECDGDDCAICRQHAARELL